MLLSTAHTTESGEAIGRSRTTQAPTLVVLEGEEIARSWRVDADPLVIGRDAAADIVLPDPKCSRRHARVSWSNRSSGDAPAEILLEDLGSTNGTWVNGERLHGTRLLADHDRVFLSSTLIGYSLRNDEELEAQRRLVLAATTDVLTGLSNRDVFERTLAREVDRARRYGRQLSVAVLDIDNFKRINDAHGHRFGDLVLRQVGRILRDALRTCDLGSRWGGEEFALLLPETPPEGAFVVAERVRMAIAAFPVALGVEPVSVTVSVGVATLTPILASPEALFECADGALYRAKATGKNRTIVGG